MRPATRLLLWLFVPAVLIAALPTPVSTDVTPLPQTSVTTPEDQPVPQTRLSRTGLNRPGDIAGGETPAGRDGVTLRLTGKHTPAHR